MKRSVITKLIRNFTVEKLKYPLTSMLLWSSVKIQTKTIVKKTTAVYRSFSIEDLNTERIKLFGF